MTNYISFLLDQVGGLLLYPIAHGGPRRVLLCGQHTCLGLLASRLGVAYFGVIWVDTVPVRVEGASKAT